MCLYDVLQSKTFNYDMLFDILGVFFYVLGVTQNKARALDIPDEPLKVKGY